MIITFDEMMEAALPLLPNNTTHETYLDGRLKLYRSDIGYLAIGLNGLGAYNFHKSDSSKHLNDDISQMILKRTMEYINQHNASFAPRELTLREIADKFNVPITSIKIVEGDN